ncbi:MAG: hypothetical protein OXC72_14355 [Roseovarius sp.]|nr:hypothetical protein [Roseovarius sp.]MCY4292919.1 hypothetical protein [Roseovarius sp.]MCY4317072.1 hypothetical protein [Roseovarius sp.]
MYEYVNKVYVPSWPVIIKIKGSAAAEVHTKRGIEEVYIPDEAYGRNTKARLEGGCYRARIGPSKYPLQCERKPWMAAWVEITPLSNAQENVDIIMDFLPKASEILSEINQKT